MDRVYVNRLPGQRRIHIEIKPNETADLLADLAEDTPYDHPTTDTLVELLTAAHALFVEDEDDANDATRQASPKPTGAPDQPAGDPLNNPRQPAFDAVFTHIRALGAYMPPSPVHRNAMIWRAVNSALDATPVGRCVSSHCVEGNHVIDLGPADSTPGAGS